MKIAIILFNLGGPDGPESVAPFLFNLFNDPNIMRLPGLLRTPLAHFIAKKRAPAAHEIYAKMGGASPLLANTELQARALEGELADLGTVTCIIAMRYWKPQSDAAARQAAAFAPDRVVLLPLYPQFSTTTTASSLHVFRRAARDTGLSAPTAAVCCYPTEPGFIAAMTDNIRAAYAAAAACGKPRLLFSAHGLPERIVASGDPYQWQCEQTAAALARALGIEGLDWVNCYQSRVGPLAWIGPATDAEIRRAGRDKVPVVIAPISFVSEHAETLVELDIEYRRLAADWGVPFYARAQTAGTAPDFIKGLAGLVRGALALDKAICSNNGVRLCPAVCGGCLCKAEV